MGVQFSVKNNRHEVSMDLEDGKSVLSFKVKDRRNAINPQHYIHYKRYKYFQLPAQIKAKFKTVSDFHKHLSQNAEIITIGEKDVIIDLDGQKINVPFQNVNQESKIFCETENIQRDNNKKEMQQSIHIVIGNQKPGHRNNNAIEKDDENSKDTMKKVLKKLMKRNDPIREINLKNQTLSELVQIIEKEWNKFEKNGATIPNMMKKKTQEATNEKEGQNSQILALKADLQKKTRSTQALRIQFDCYKECFNFEKFNEEQRKTQDNTRKRVIQEFLSDISDHFNRLTNNMNTNNIMVQITTKVALFSRIQNMVRQLSEYRNQDNSNRMKNEIKPSNPKQSKMSNGFSEILERDNLNEVQKIQISNRLSFDRQ